MNDKTELVRCKELILYRFKIDDLKHCLHGVSCNATGKKDDLQRRLRNILESEKTQKKAKNVILGRGVDMGYIDRSEQSNFNDISTTKFISKSTNNYSSTENNIRMKNLYFHKNINRLTDWKIIRSNDNNQPIFLNIEISKELYRSLISSKENEQSKNCLFLRCTKIEQNTQSVPLNDCYPILMQMFINGQDFTNYLPREICYSSADKKIRLSAPTLLNKPLLNLLKYNFKDGHVKIEIRYDKDENKNDTFGFALFSSTLRTVQEIFEEITNKKRVTFEKFDSDLKKFMSTSGDVTLESARIPLFSSITLTTIKTPFRGKNCNHIIPDDLKEYITMNMYNESWICRICQRKCTPDDIMIDEFFMNILSKHPTVDGIELYPGMKYKLYGGNEILSINKSIVSTKRKIDDAKIIMIDSDDEFETPLKDKNVSKPHCKNEINFEKLTETCSSNAKQVDCIVIDDSSDEEPVQKRVRSEKIPNSTNDILPINTFSKKSKQKNNITQSVILNSNDDINEQTSTKINVSNDSFISNQLIKPDSSLVNHTGLKLSNYNQHTSKNSSNKSIPFDYTRKAISKLDEDIQNNCPVFDEFIKGFISENIYNIDDILNREVKDGILSKDHLSLKPQYINNELQNTININSMMPIFSETSNIKQYFKDQDEQLSDLKKFVDEIDKVYGYVNPSSI